MNIISRTSIKYFCPIIILLVFSSSWYKNLNYYYFFIFTLRNLIFPYVFYLNHIHFIFQKLQYF